MQSEASSEVVRRFCYGIAETRAELVRFAARMRLDPRVRSCAYTMDLPKYQYASPKIECREGTELQQHVGAELLTGDALCWSLVVLCTKREWALEAQVLLYQQSGETVLRQVVSESYSSIDEVLGELPTTTARLVAECDLASLIPRTENGSEKAPVKAGDE
jgi:hypothetical protein